MLRRFFFLSLRNKEENRFSFALKRFCWAFISKTQRRTSPGCLKVQLKQKKIQRGLTASERSRIGITLSLFGGITADGHGGNVK